VNAVSGEQIFDKRTLSDLLLNHQMWGNPSRRCPPHRTQQGSGEPAVWI